MAISVKVGELRHVVEVQRFETVMDEHGFATENWTTITTTRAKIEFDDRLMREIFRDEGNNSSNVKIFTFRYFEGLTTKDRIFSKGVPYSIYGIDDVDNLGRYYKVWGRTIC